ncbi:MAG: efflux RND transporter periplasmic adaptor subunit [Deltaproteobacteria bacterium]|nr:efflux RND transporter periplasmic adaptor subunit [Deltaproteobacteria bacterium]
METLAVKEGQTVGKGQLVARLSSEEIEAVLEQARAEVEAFKNRLKEAEAGINGIDTSIEQAKVDIELTREASFHRIHRAKAALQKADASIEEARSSFDFAKREYERYSELVKEEVVSRRQFEEMEMRFKASEARLRAAEEAREEAKALFESAEVSATEVKLKEKEYQRLLDERRRSKATHDRINSQLDSAVARVREVEARFKDTEVLAPSGGTIINKLAEEGEIVTEGMSLAVIVDLSDIYVKVFIPEKDIGKIRLGNPARIYTDAFPGRFFNGKITEVSQKAEFTPKEVHMKEERVKLVFGVKAGIENPEGYLKPGMPVDVRIRWKEDVPW